MAQADIDSFLVLVRGKDVTQLGPSFFAINRLSMFDMLQALDQLSPEDLVRFGQAAGFAQPGQAGCICGGLGPLAQTFQVNIDRIQFAFRVVGDRTIPATIPGDLYETRQVMDAFNFLGKPVPTKNVWMTVIGEVCEDAFLHQKGKSDITIGSDATNGQAGWDIGITYSSGGFNPGLLQVIKRRCQPFYINKLAINAHGGNSKIPGTGGEFDVNGIDSTKPEHPPIDPPLTVPTIIQFAPMWQFFRRVIIDDGILFLMGCLAGRGDQGTQLLTELSMTLRPRKIVGFTTIGFQDTYKQRREGGDGCMEPGVRDGDVPLPDSDEHFTKMWDNLNLLPWESEISPHSKVARNGGIIHQGADAQ
jgi:hypothetical protein